MNAGEIWSLPFAISAFAVASILILVFGVRMTRDAADLAARSSLGDTLVGALLLGITTSLPEIATSSTAALDGHANLAVSNAIGSVAGQTVFLAIVDMTYRKANLEHAAASAENLVLGTLLVVLLATVMIGVALPDVVAWHIHPATILLFAAYFKGLHMVSEVHTQPMWMPRRTRETDSEDHADTTPGGRSLPGLWSSFAVGAALTAFSGWLLARAAVPISIHSGLSETLVGGVLTGLAGSMPELVTALAAVRLGALSLAVGDILGGNCFDALIVGFSDVLYTEGSVYTAAGPHLNFLLALTTLLAAILLMGLVFREKHGVANIGLESFLLLLLYIAGMAMLLIAP
ncbi:MAG: sodium:calcium antiporter [Gammaproteobacteria bacterium]